jgi:hypothetical protein
MPMQLSPNATTTTIPKCEKEPKNLFLYLLSIFLTSIQGTKNKKKDKSQHKIVNAKLFVLLLIIKLNFGQLYK